MKTRRSAGVGSVSLVLIFSTLCLSIFSVLSLSDAVSQKHTAELLAKSAENYYSADTEATRIYALLAAIIKAGETPPDTLCGTAVSADTDETGTYYSFTCDIDENQVLEVEILRANGTLTITKWAKAAREEWVGDDDISVLQ